MIIRDADKLLNQTINHEDYSCYNHHEYYLIFRILAQQLVNHVIVYRRVKIAYFGKHSTLAANEGGIQLGLAFLSSNSSTPSNTSIE